MSLTVFHLLSNTIDSVSVNSETQLCDDNTGTNRVKGSLVFIAMVG